jgi:ribosomal protein S18 acetylase RimI-like enzyme
MAASSDDKYEVVAARGPSDLVVVRELFTEYAASIGIDLAFQKFDEELAGLPGRYAPPSGELLLAALSGVWIGCIGMRQLSPTVAEMKRLYVRPQARGHGLGRKLAQEIMRVARSAGYRAIRLDTLESMEPATNLYSSLGFVEIEPYCDNPTPGARFFEAEL